MKQVTPEAVVAHIEKLGLRSCAIHKASEVAAVLSQPRACLVMMRTHALMRGDSESVALCDTGIKVLTSVIGDNFKSS